DGLERFEFGHGGVPGGIGLDEQERTGVVGQTEIAEGVDHRHGGPVHEFEHRGCGAGGHVRRDRVPDSISGKIPTPVTGGASFGLSARVISTMTPRVPSEQRNSAARSRPATPFAVCRPTFVTVPSASTTVRART